MKFTQTYWNPLDKTRDNEWEDIDGSNGNLSQITLAQDSVRGLIEFNFYKG
ncbi:hypothetical protein [Vibrio sp. A2-1]|uniref:hypothetical protein n=1 Tax=Vibrio sp. A2-1 TaxID=2912252 RepID=UPI001F4718D3|nr:hypothetical protein [Vibrio sp. A2-1]MCF7486753.1 hypothetical protein [Vibrio sp. A2-1]